MPTTRILPLATSTNQGFVISDTFIPAKRSEGNAITNLWLRPDSSPDPSLRATLHRPFKSSANSQTSPSPKSVISSEISPAVCVLLRSSRAPVGSFATELSRYASKTLPPLLYKCGGSILIKIPLIKNGIYTQHLRLRLNNPSQRRVRRF